MSKNPFINALAAAVYVALVGSLMYYGPHVAGKVDGVIVPVAMISLFTLSAAVMGYLFLLQPAQMYLDGAKKEAITLFLKTVVTFAVITAIFFVLLFASSGAMVSGA